MKNTTQMWDGYYKTLNTEAYSRPPQSYHDFPTVNRAVLKILADDLHIFKKPKYVHFSSSGMRSMIELGCGGANISLALIGNQLVDKVVLVDFSKKINKYVDKIIETTGYNIQAVNADVLKFRTKERFDLVYSGGLLDHFDGKRLDAVMKKHATLCKHGGYVVTVVPFNSKFMKLLSEMKGIPESKLTYKLFEHEEIQELFKKNKLDIIYHARHAISIRPHVANKRPLNEKLENLPLWIIHNLGILWKVYEFLEREFPNIDFGAFFRFVSDCVLCYGMMHGDYLMTVGRKK